MYRRMSVAIVVLGAVVILAVTPALAGTVAYTGDTTGGPTFNRSFQDCSGYAPSTAVPYDAQPFFVSADGLYSFSSIQSGFDGYLFLYGTSFDPSDSMMNCLGGNDDGGGGNGTSDFDYTLSAGAAYVLVTSGFADDQFGPFSNTISGPGTITLGTPAATSDVPGEDMVDISPEAVVGTFLVDTPVYYAPKADAVTTTVMEAGKTVWVYGVDSSKQYYRAMIAGHFFWVPVNTLGTNPDEVWNNTPLPQVVIANGSTLGSTKNAE